MTVSKCLLLHQLMLIHVHIVECKVSSTYFIYWSSRWLHANSLHFSCLQIQNKRFEMFHSPVVCLFFRLFGESSWNHSDFLRQAAAEPHGLPRKQEWWASYVCVYSGLDMYVTIAYLMLFDFIYFLFRRQWFVESSHAVLPPRRWHNRQHSSDITFCSHRPGWP